LKTTEFWEAAQPRHKFQTLDALRGVAAIVVVMYHNRALFGWTPSHGYLAVDLFFNLSGFVLSYAYQSRLDSGLPTTAFLRDRIVRLAPLYLLALALGIVAMGVAGPGGWLHLTWMQHLGYVGLGVFLLPAHSAAQPGLPLFPYNYPSWTLFLELLMNIGHALFLRRLRTAVLGSICATSALVLVAIYIYAHTINAGWDWGTLFTVGISRVIFSYTCGMLLFRAWRMGSHRVKLPASPLLLLAFAALVLPTPHQAISALLMILFLVPAIVYCGALNEPGKISWRIFGSLGAASYAIYVLHAPFFVYFQRAWPAAAPHVPWSGMLMLAALIFISLLIDRFYDTPVRKALRRRAS
jgi:peptidoglycan/LPS O-acetylase OafA/YrhL